VELFWRSFSEKRFGEAFWYLPVGAEKSEIILSDTRIKGISFIGSVDAGKKVAEMAGRYAKKCVMELGGSDPFIVLDDANLNDAARNAAIGRFKNLGQAYNCSKRFLVPKQHFNEFVELLKKEIEKYPVGYPFDPKTKSGPLAKCDLVNELKKQTLDSIKSGAKLLY
jgi:succinate-semialdehyde dehydrogenase/glutarate-semialdehyde dehydrogenase